MNTIPFVILLYKIFETFLVNFKPFFRYKLNILLWFKQHCLKTFVIKIVINSPKHKILQESYYITLREVFLPINYVDELTLWKLRSFFPIKFRALNCVVTVDMVFVLFFNPWDILETITSSSPIKNSKWFFLVPIR